MKFCGLDLATCQSGTFRGRTKLSKYGNARSRRTFWMAAQVAARQRYNSFRDKLGRYTAGYADDADPRRKEMTALTAKMARVAHAVVKTGTSLSFSRSARVQPQYGARSPAFRCGSRIPDGHEAGHEVTVAVPQRGGNSGSGYRAMAVTFGSKPRRAKLEADHIAVFSVRTLPEAFP